MTQGDGYQLIQILTCGPDDTGHGKMLGVKNPRRCRFCKRIQPEAKFTKDAHVIPQGLGNRAHKSYDECDECNDYGSALENDLLTFLSPFRPFARQRSQKRSSYKLKPRASNGKSYIESTAGKDIIRIVVDPSDPSVQTIPLGANQFELRVVRNPYRPINVAKALARVAWFCLPHDQLAKYEYIRRWIRGEISPLPIRYIFGFIPGTGFKNTIFGLHQSTDFSSATPPLLAHLIFGNSAVLFHMVDEKFSVERQFIPDDKIFDGAQFDVMTWVRNERLPRTIQPLPITYVYTSRDNAKPTI